MIIALYGEKRVGKDTTANILQKYFPNLEKRAFANIPKNILCKTLNISLAEFENNKEKYRPYLIRFAEEMKKYFGKDIWAKLVTKDNILITDLRFKEEYEYIKKFNPIIIKIIDKNILQKNIDILPYDYIINNSKKDLKSLEEQVQKIVKKIKENVDIK